MAWFVLVFSGVLESVWATALGRSEGFTRLVPSIVFLVSMTASMAGLAYAMKTIPIGTAYVVWVGIGGVLTVLIAIATGTETASPLKLVFLAGIILCIVGLKTVK